VRNRRRREHETGDAVWRAGTRERDPSGRCPAHGEERRACDESIFVHAPPDAARSHMLRGPYRVVVGVSAHGVHASQRRPRL